jgi:hypothetical protein
MPDPVCNPSPPVDIPTSTPPIYYQTGNTNLAAALIATGLLRYVRPLRLARVTVFVFEDPEQMGQEYERRFLRDALPHCSPRGFSQARSFLIDEIDKLAGTARQGGHREPR